jgi:hypothetical protein
MKMSRWVTSEMVKLLSGVAGIASVEVHSQGGDVDTSNLILNIKDVADARERLFVCGFTTEGYITTPDDTEIEMIQLTDGQQSDTGLSSDVEEICLAYGRVMSTLRRAGFTVVESLKAYF